LHSALGAEDDSTPRIRFRAGNAEGNVKCPSNIVLLNEQGTGVGQNVLQDGTERGKRDEGKR